MAYFKEVQHIKTPHFFLKFMKEAECLVLVIIMLMRISKITLNRRETVNSTIGSYP